MATPTSHPHPQKQPAASHLTPASASSPQAPPSSHSGTNRSIPSPAYSAALKAPQRPLHHRNGSKDLPPGGTPRTVPTPRPGTASAADSPAVTAAAAMLMEGQYGFPPGAGMGLGLTPRGVGLTPVAMQMTGSQGGISAVVAQRDQEEERKRRVETIVGLMAGRWGFVSQEGVERCARRLGLECLWEESMGEERKRMLTIAGHGVLADVEFRGEEIRGVVLQFEGSSDRVVEGAEKAAELLRKDLRGDEEVGKDYVMLDGFVRNMERLANMDRLGGEEINCFDAIDGIYQSLEKVYTFENGKSKQTPSRFRTTEALCHQSGRPVMHSNGRVGLSLQYWKERRLVSSEKSSPTDDGDMDVEKPEDAYKYIEGDTWSAIIECEASPADLYPPIRISNAWVSPTIEKPEPLNAPEIPTSGSSIDWQDPPPTLLSPKSPSNGASNLDIDLNPQPRSPDVRFVAKFEPPVIVPLQMAIQIHASVGSPLAQESILPTTYEQLVFADTDTQSTIPPPNPRVVEKKYISYDLNTPTPSTHSHKLTLHTQPNDYARAITNLPFSHPKQIIALLPILRQWALVASILRRSFMTDSLDDEISPSSQNGDTSPTAQTSDAPTFQSLEAELADFLSSPPASNAETSTSSNAKSARNIGVTLTTTPLPHFTIHFPNPRSNNKSPTGITFSIGPNGIIENTNITDNGNHPTTNTNGLTNNGPTNGNVEVTEESVKGDLKPFPQRLQKVVEISESIDILVEWLCRNQS